MRPEHLRPGLLRPEPFRAETVRAETVRPETVRPELVRRTESNFLSAAIPPTDHLDSEMPHGEVNSLIKFLQPLGALPKVELGEQALRADKFKL